MPVAMVNQRTGQPVCRPLTARHLLVVGQTGSGKTTTTLALLNELQQTDQTAIILDPTGEYAQLPNAVTYRLGANAYLEGGGLTQGSSRRFWDLLCRHGWTTNYPGPSTLSGFSATCFNRRDP